MSLWKRKEILFEQEVKVSNQK